MKLFLTLLFFSVSVCTYAQQPTITWRELSNDEFQFKAIVSEPHTNNLLKLSLQREGKKKNAKWNAVLTKYDGAINILASTTLTNPSEEGRYEYLLQTGEKVFAIFRQEVKGNDDEYSFTAQQVDPVSLRLTGPSISIGTFEVIKSGKVINRPFLVSDNGKNVLFFGFNRDAKAKTSGFPLVQFDENMQEKWRKFLTNPDHGFHRIIGITNQGVGLAYKVEFASEKSFESKVSLLQVSTTAVDQIPVEVPGQTINSLHLLSETPTGCKLFGLYADVAGRGHSGYFTVIINATEKKSVIGIKEHFDLSLLQKLSKREEAFNKPLHATSSFWPAAIIKRGDMVHVVLEASGRDMLQHVRDNRNLGKRIIPESEIVTINGSILDVVLRSNESSHVNFYEKDQYTDASDMLGSGFAVLCSNDDLLFFYNGWRKNIENDKPVERNAFAYADYPKSSFVFGRMENDGTIDRKVLFENKPNGFYPSVAHFYKVNDNKIILIAQTSLDPTDVSKEVLGILEVK